MITTSVCIIVEDQNMQAVVTKRVYEYVDTNMLNKLKKEMN